jgi:hypothetical protein
MRTKMNKLFAGICAFLVSVLVAGCIAEAEPDDEVVDGLTEAEPSMEIQGTCYTATKCQWIYTTEHCPFYDPGVPCFLDKYYCADCLVCPGKPDSCGPAKLVKASCSCG